MKNYKIFQLVLLLTPFVFSFAFGLDIYIPIVPQMTRIYDTTPSLVQLTLSLFLLITGLGQIFIGPLSDQIGRKRVFYLASSCFALGSLLCAFSHHILWLIAARMVSAAGACGMLVTGFALVRDLYHSDQSARIYSFLNGSIGISPTFAPLLGGYLDFYFGWQSVFFFLAALGLFAFFITNQFIEETHSPEQRVKVNRDVFIRYWKIVSHHQFITYAAIAGFAEAVFFCFFSISPFIIIDLSGIPTHQFGYYFAVFGSVIALGGLSSGKLIGRIGTQKTILTGIVLMFLGGLGMLASHALFSLTLPGFLIPMAIACTGAMFLIGGSAALAMEPFGAIAGTAAAAFGALEFGISAIIGSILMLFPVTSTIPYGIVIVMMAILSLYLFLRRRTETVES
jgi:Bcr/CflA subfamily drug resistance transporter